MKTPPVSSQPALPFLRIAVLVLIAEQDGHGYALNDRLAAMGVAEPNKTRLYRLLRSLEDEGVIASTWVPADRGPARRVYEITTSGLMELRTTAPTLATQRRVIAELMGRMRNIVSEEPAPVPPPKRVLIVDDEADLRLTMMLLLEERGWEVVEASDGIAAMETCAAVNPTAVVLDERMPGMAGIEVARELRADGFSEPIVLYSAYLTPSLESESRALQITPVGKANLSALLAALEPGAA